MTEAEQLFEQVYRTYGPSLYRFCLIQMKNPADAEDILQEVFCKRLYRAPVFASPDHERRWLFRVALNQCRDAWKRSSRSELPLEAASAAVTPEELGLLDHVAALPESQRTVLHLHYYEGYTMQQVTFPVRVMQQIGIKYLFVSNASGGINPSFRVGDLMVITDHINLMPNPLIGPNMAEFGPRFPDMHNCYDQHLIIRATRIAEEKGIKLQYGVYVGGTGPTFETQAEYRYFKAIGGDAAGMSTVPEVIVARHMSIPVFGVSVITNCGLSDEVGDHEDVQRQGAKAGVKMAELFMEMIKNL